MAQAEKRVGEGDRAPSFTLQDHDDRAFASSSLKGRPFVLYFYPRADTPG